MERKRTVRRFVDFGEHIKLAIINILYSKASDSTEGESQPPTQIPSTPERGVI